MIATNFGYGKFLYEVSYLCPGGITMKKILITFLMLIVLCSGINVDAYVSDGVDAFYFKELLESAQPIVFNQAETGTRVDDSEIAYKLYVPVTLDVTVTVTFDKDASELSSYAWLIDINNDYCYMDLSIQKGRRNGENYSVTCKETVRLNAGYYILAVNPHHYGSKTNTKITGTLPTKPSVTKLKKQGKKSAVLKWNRINSVTGYQVYRRTGTFGKYSKVKTLNSTSFVNKKLKKNKTYYYKVRAYQNIGGTVFYSPFSSAKKIKMK